MDPLTALGLVCNIFQIISISAETITLYQKIRKDGTPDKELGLTTRRLGESSKQIEIIITATAQDSSKLTQPHRELIEVAQSCHGASIALIEELNRVFTAHGGTVGRTLRSLRSKSKIAELEKTLERHSRVLETKLLQQIWTEQDAIIVEQRDGFVSLDKSLQEFVKKFLQGQAKLSDLISTKAGDEAAAIAAEHAKTRDKIAKEHNRTRNLTVSEHQKTRHHVEEIKDTVLQSESDRQIEARYQSVIDSLQYSGMNARRQQIVESEEGTFDWIFGEGEQTDISRPEALVSSSNASAFHTFLRSDQGLFWICGKPGSGKSTLMKFLATHERTLQTLREWIPDCAIYSYFIWNSGSLAQRNIDGLLSALLFQIFNGNKITARSLIEKYDLTEKRAIDDWSTWELQKTLEAALASQTTAVCLFIDGLDEIEIQEGPVQLSRILRSIGQSQERLKICVSSRPEAFWKQYFSRLECPSIKLQDLTMEDMDKCARAMLSEFPIQVQITWTAEDTEEMVNLLVHKAEGVFLWLRLALKSLQRGITNSDSKEMLLERINALPTDIKSLYRSMWSRLGDDEVLYTKNAALYFKLLLSQQRMGYRGPNIFPIMISCDSSLQARILDPENSIFQEHCFSQEYDRFKSRVEAATALFLEVTKIDLEKKPTFGELRASILEMETINFIHRTAADFLAHTSDGRRIMQMESSSPEQIDVLVQSSDLLANLYRAYIFRKDKGHLYVKEFENRGQEPILASAGAQVLNLTPQEESKFFALLKEIYLYNSLEYLHERASNAYSLESVRQLQVQIKVNPELESWLYSYSLEIPGLQYSGGPFSTVGTRNAHRLRMTHAVSWLLKNGVNPNHCKLMWTPTQSVGFSQLLNHLEVILLTAVYGSIEATSIFFQVIQALVPCTVCLDRRILVPVALDSSEQREFVLQNWLIYTSDADALHCSDYVLLEVDTAALVNIWLRLAIPKLKIAVPPGMNGTRHENEDCHMRVLLYGENSKDKAPIYRKPTTSESKIMLPHVEEFLSHKFKHPNKTETVSKLGWILQDNENTIHDIPSFLRDMGHFIPTDEQVREFKNASDPISRIQIWKNLNEMAAKMDFGKAQFSDNATEILRALVIPTPELEKSEDEVASHSYNLGSGSISSASQAFRVFGSLSILQPEHQITQETPTAATKTPYCISILISDIKMPGTPSRYSDSS